MHFTKILSFCCCSLLFLLAGFSLSQSSSTWTFTEQSVIRGLALSNLGAVPKDPSNRVADDPKAASFGHKLFF